MHIKLIIADPTKEQMESARSLNNKDVTIVSASNIENTSQYYNNELLNSNADIVGFMSGSDSFYHRDALDKIIEEFKRYDNVGVVYSDKYLNKDNILIHQIFPIYSDGDATIFNPIIFVNGKIRKPIFDLRLNHLRSYDVIQRLGKTSYILHIPEPLFVSKFIPVDISEELKIYVGQSN